MIIIELLPQITLILLEDMSKYMALSFFFKEWLHLMFSSNNYHYLKYCPTMIVRATPLRDNFVERIPNSVMSDVVNVDANHALTSSDFIDVRFSFLKNYTITCTVVKLLTFHWFEGQHFLQEMIKYPTQMTMYSLNRYFQDTLLCLNFSTILSHYKQMKQ